jgi:hypothetical protein
MKKQLCEDEDDHKGNTDRDVISWNEFKVFRTRCKKKRDDLCKILKVQFGDDGSDDEKNDKKTITRNNTRELN